MNKSVKSIGGYFELEIPLGKNLLHANADYFFKSGRSCLKHIVKVFKPSKIYIPFYNCKEIEATIIDLQVPYEFYSLNQEFEIKDQIDLKENELFFYINYFGLKSKYASKLSTQYQSSFILDNTHSFYFDDEISNSWVFNSCRKFFGVPDGAYLFEPSKFSSEILYNQNSLLRTNHLIDRLENKTKKGYEEFLTNETELGAHIELASQLTTRVLSNLNHNFVMKRRVENYNYLNQNLESKNRMEIDLNPNGAIPFFYPYVSGKFISKEKFWNKNVFIQNCWKECYETNLSGFNFEKALSKKILPLPIDQRYGIEDMERILKLINEFE